MEFTSSSWRCEVDGGRYEIERTRLTGTFDAYFMPTRLAGQRVRVVRVDDEGDEWSSYGDACDACAVHNSRRLASQPSPTVAGERTIPRPYTMPVTCADGQTQQLFCSGERRHTMPVAD